MEAIFARIEALKARQGHLNSQGRLVMHSLKAYYGNAWTKFKNSKTLEIELRDDVLPYVLVGSAELMGVRLFFEVKGDQIELTDPSKGTLITLPDPNGLYKYTHNSAYAFGETCSICLTPASCPSHKLYLLNKTMRKRLTTNWNFWKEAHYQVYKN